MKILLRSALLASAAVILVAAGCAKSSTTATNSSSSVTSAATVSITSSGFVPATVTVKAGQAVTWKNTATSTHWPASNPHPEHTGLSGFDALRGLSAGETYSYTFARAGTFPYHDHLNPLLTGTVIVE